MEFLEDLHKVIKKYTTLPFDNYLLQMNAEYRYYHNLSHVEYLFNLINKLYAEDPEINRLKYLAAIHDYYYNPKLMNGENEKKSAELSKSIYYKFNKYPHDILYDAIIDTATHKNYSSELSRKFGELDMHILKSEFIGDLIQYEEKIMKEFQFCDYSLYKEGRLKFLHSLDQNDYESIHQLIDYVDNKQIDLGIYPGSFYPLHNGHEYVLDQTKHLFDKTILAFGKNPNKAFDREKEVYITSLKNSNKLFNQIEVFDNLLANFVSNLDKKLYKSITIIKGIRNSQDLEFEKIQEQYTKEFNPNIKFIYILTPPHLQHISSSAIKDLKSFDIEKAKKYTNYPNW